MAETAIEWTHRDGTVGKTWNPTTGCDRISAGCDNCLTPETRVLRADMTWVPIVDVKVGDRLVSFTDTPTVGQNRIWEEATVLATWETEKPTVTFTLSNGASITASEDHRWLIAKRGLNTWWRQTVDLNFKTQVRTIRCEPTDTDCPAYWAGYIAGATAGDGTFRWPATEPGQQVYWRIAKPFRDRVVLDRVARFLGAFGIEVTVQAFDSGTSGFTDTPLPMAKVETRKAAHLAAIAEFCEERDTREWRAGWLAGMFDTDASYTGGNLRYCQAKPNDVLDRVIRYGKELDFEFRRETWEHSCPGARLVGGIPENIAFLSAISPVMPHRLRDFYGKRVETTDLFVTGVTRGPVRRLIDITTSTGTFVAEGALTHNCYALTLAKRLKGMGSAKYQNDGDPRTSGPGFGITTHADTLSDPLRWRKPATVFVNSMSDLFHARVPRSFVVQVFAVMAATPQHTYQILTKRPERMARMLTDLCTCGKGHTPGVHFRSDMDWAATKHSPTYVPGVTSTYHTAAWPLPNVWLGTSIESDDHIRRADALRATPAAVRFISAEPLLSPLPSLDLTGIDWLIAGGESGPGAREMDQAWVRDLIFRCRASGTAPFVKQLGSRWAQDTFIGGQSVSRTDTFIGGQSVSRTDKKGGDWTNWDYDLRIREYPTTVDVADTR
jgi:protein gp37